MPSRGTDAQHASCVDFLPLTESAFTVLEEAYERQWLQSSLIHEESRSSTISDTIVQTSGVVAAELRSLWAETVRLHQRYAAITRRGAPPFTQKEVEALQLLGFRLPSPPLHPSQTCAKHPTCSSGTTYSPYNESVAALRDENKRLRASNAQLGATLAWYTICGGPSSAAPGIEKTKANPRGEESAAYTAAGAYTRLNEIRHRYKSLTATESVEEPVLSASGSIPQSEDIAIEELLRQLNFPSRVRVRRMTPEGLFMVDRPMRIRFASSWSSTLVVEDPEQTERDCPLKSYLVEVYAPLLEALGWRAPPGP